MRLFALLVGLALITLLPGCATTFMYDNQNYPTSMAATEAARQDIRRKVAAVPEREAPLAGSVLILTPSVQWARQVVVTTGTASEELIQYVATTQYFGFYGMAEALQRRRIFSNTSIQEFSQRDPLGQPDYEFIIWLRLDGPYSAQWMISPGKDTSAARSLFTSPVSDPGDRVSRFVESVEQYIAQIKK